MFRARNLTLFVLLVLACFPAVGVARTVTEIISGGLVESSGIAVDASGTAYVAGRGSDNAFKISPNGVVSEIIDSTGDGMGNTLDSPEGMAVDNSGNYGSSWADGFNDLQDTLDVVQRNDQIWVAAGTYTPSARTDPDDRRSATFQLINGVAIYGGFAGLEASLEERDIEPNATVALRTLPVEFRCTLPVGD